MKVSLTGSSSRRERQRWRHLLRYRGTKSGRWRERSPPRVTLSTSPIHFWERLRVSNKNRNRSYGLSDHNGLWVRGQHLSDQLVSSTGKGQRLSIVALRLPIGIQANNGNDSIRLGCQLDGFSHLHIGILDFCTAKTDTGVAVLNRLDLVTICRSPDVAELNENVVLDARFKVDPTLLLLRAAIEERIPTTLTRPVINDQLAVDKELEGERVRTAYTAVGNGVSTLALPDAVRPNSNVQSWALGFSWPSSFMVHLRVMPLGAEVLMNMRVSSTSRDSDGVLRATMLSSLSCAYQVPIHPRSPDGVVSSKSRVGISMYANAMVSYLSRESKNDILLAPSL